ncbi:SAM-dependent methyltransferase [Amycolatopsis ultiminotia]|uniref:SAM-dependent methyltransferase n=1 Tax=Amycolatopsis ultiminotia TaxID=543629 RepID=A0ABP6WB29_9PSEU
MLDDENAPVGVDPTRSSVARVYDYLLGGKDHYDVDRAMGDQIIAKMPEVRDVARENRAFLIRACRFLATNAGIRQFLDCGSGQPTAENVHQVVQRIHSDARVLYSDYDPVVASRGRALLVEDERTNYLEADIFEPAGILEHELTRSHLDWSEPIALLFVAALHHYKGDLGRPAEVTKEYIDALPSGSYVVITHVLDPHDGGQDDETLQETLQVIRDGSMRDITARTREQIRELFHGLELVAPGPGQPAEIVPVAHWWPDGPQLGAETIAQRIIAAGVGRKP